MSMTILNNTASMMTLGELNKNITKVGRQLKKVSTGQRLNGADDNASDYGISEQMRAKIRALEQDVQNVQNGSSMLKVALGGIQSIVEELRDLKELAIDAANDSNSDADRATMQKVLKQKQANIDNIAASTSFNSKVLLDGTYRNPHWKETYKIQYGVEGDSLDALGISTENTKEKVMTLGAVDIKNIDNLAANLRTNDLANRKVNINVTEKMNTVIGLAAAFEAMHNGVTFADGTTAVETRDTALYAQRPEDIVGESIVPNRNFIRASGGAPLAVRIDFTGAVDSEGNAIFKGGYADSYSISQLNGQVFSILNSDTGHFVNIRFSTSTQNGDVDWDTLNGWTGNNNNDDSTGDIEYVVNLQKFIDAGGVTHSDFLNGIFEGIRECNDRQYISAEYKLNKGLNYIADNVNNISLSQKYNIRMARDSDGNVYLTKLEPYSYNLGILDEG